MKPPRIAASTAAACLLARELRRDTAWAAAQVRAYAELTRGYLLRAPVASARPAVERVA